MTATAHELDSRPGGVSRRRRAWPWILGLGVVLAVVAVRGMSGRRAAADASARGREARPVPVVTAAAKTGDVPVYLRGLGTATAFNTATVRSRVDGQLLSVVVKEGQTVREGEVLAQIDPRPFEVQLEQAKGQLARDRASLKDAQVILDRDQSLLKDQILAQQDFDSQKARVAQFDGAIQSDLAMVSNAELQLSYARIVAPFSGRVGLRLVDIGNIVHASDLGGLFVLTQVHPIAVVFSLPQDDLQLVTAKIQAGVPLPVLAYDRDNSKQVAEGKLLTIDNQIDPATGTYKLKAVFDNKDDSLFPNQFVNVRLHIDTRKGLVIVPQVAVQRGSKGTYVYVVDKDKAARVRPVTVALNEGGASGTTAGVAAGETVVVDGQDKLQDGTKVDVATRSGGPRGEAANAAGDAQ
jgi:membrane fusion protein, multidrug efflux system